MDEPINNLEFLSESIDMENIIVNGRRIEQKGDYDFVLTLEILEYPILYSFVKVMSFIEHSPNLFYKRYSKIDMMELCDKVLENLYNLYNDIENSEDINKKENNKSFYELMDYLDYKFNKLIENRKSLYIRLNESFQFLYGSFCDALLESKRYLYISNNERIYFEGNDLVDDLNNGSNDDSDNESNDESNDELNDESNDDSDNESEDFSSEEERIVD